MLCAPDTDSDSDTDPDSPLNPSTCSTWLKRRQFLQPSACFSHH